MQGKILHHAQETMLTFIVFQYIYKNNKLIC